MNRSRCRNKCRSLVPEREILTYTEIVQLTGKEDIAKRERVCHEKYEPTEDGPAG